MLYRCRQTIAKSELTYGRCGRRLLALRFDQTYFGILAETDASHVDHAFTGACKHISQMRPDFPEWEIQ
jgi:hypothetical protein